MFEVCDRTTLYELDRGRNKRDLGMTSRFCRTENRFSGIRFKEEEAMAFVQVVRQKHETERSIRICEPDGWKRFL